MNPQKARAGLELGNLSASHCSEYLFTHCSTVIKARHLAAEIDRLQAELQSLQMVVSSMRDEQRATRHTAEHDELTGLPNRAFFSACLEACLHGKLSTPNGLAVLFIDIDHFKDVNDNYGHAAGDALLKIVATRLNRAMRKNDVVCRLGGDEFACLLTGIPDKQQLARLARKLLSSIATPCALNGIMVDTQISIGIAMSFSGNQDGARLLAMADAAMYTAKRTGSGFAFAEAIPAGL